MYLLNIIDELRTIDIIILVLVVFIFIFLLFLTSSLIKKNKELKLELIKLSGEKNSCNCIREKVENIIKEGINDDNTNSIIDDIDIEIKEEENIEEILESLPEIEETGPYKKNVLRELSARSQTSPVNIGNSTVDVPKVKVTSYVKKEENKEKINKVKKIDEMDNQTFIEEISKRIEDEMTPQTIELTDYERKQEEEAIISYQELLKVKDKLYNITDDEEIDNFIDELKEFRTNLE